MITLTENQKQDILKYVEDKTYFNRIGFVIGIVISMVAFFYYLLECTVLQSNDIEILASCLTCCLMGLIISMNTFKDVLKFRNVRY